MEYRKLAKGIGEAVAKRTILRKKENGRLENWYDVAHRVALGNTLLTQKPDDLDTSTEYEQLRNHIANGTLLMSGRHLQHGDETQPTRNMEVFTNCSTATTSFLLFYLLLNGSGVGRSYDDDLCIVDWDYMPDVRCVLSNKHKDFQWGQDESAEEAKKKYKSDHVIWKEVADSREGWARAIEILEIMAYERKHTEKLVVLDFSNVRPQGSPINGMQKRPASGPRPTMHAIMNVATIKNAQMKPWQQAMWIDHYLAECVLVGGARRSARMATKYWKDPDIFEFVDIKKGGFLWSANNSIMVDQEFWSLRDAHARDVLEHALRAAYYDNTGEPGFINQDKLNQNDDNIEEFYDGKYVGSLKYQPLSRTEKLLARVVWSAHSRPYTQITNPCIVGSTKIAVADGRNAVTIKELAEQGKDVPVYSADAKTGQVQIKMARSLRRTKTQTEIWKLKLDDGSELLATPDHKVLMWDKEYVELKDLEEGDVIIPFYSYTSNNRYRQIARLGNKMSNGYYYSKRQYRGIYEFSNGEYDSSKFQIHHKDENSLNDWHDNLTLVAKSRHLSDHMKRNNPYYQMTGDWKKNFASHKAETNGRWIDITNQKLIEHGKKLFTRDGYINERNWQKYAKDNGLPQTLSNPARFGTFKNFVYQVVNNHKVISVEFYGYDDVYNMTVDDNHNYFVITSQEDDRAITSSGICVKNCGEITLAMWGGYCVIADVVPYFAKDKNDALDAFRTVARALIRVNTMDSLYNKEVKRTNRIGIGLTGLHEYAWNSFGYGFRDLIDEEKSKDFWETLSEFRDAIEDEATKYAKELKLTPPHTFTTIKPAGTTSKLFGLTEGAHLPSMREYLRWVQFRHDDPLVEKYKALGYPYKELKAYYGTIAIGFPTRPEICRLGMDSKLVTASSATPEEQYKWLILLEKYWLGPHGNQISYTLKYDPREVSYENFKEMITKYQSQVRCCAVMPQVDVTAYEYQPEEPITPDQFIRYAQDIKDSELLEDIDLESLKCESGACPI